MAPLTGIRPGDIVEVDKKGRRFHALVTDTPLPPWAKSGLSIRPFNRHETYRHATAREVCAVWRKSRARNGRTDD